SLRRSSRLSSTIKHRVISTCPSSHMSNFPTPPPATESCVDTVNAKLTSYPQLFGTEISKQHQCLAESLFSTYPQPVKIWVSPLFAISRRLRGNRTAKRDVATSSHPRLQMAGLWFEEFEVGRVYAHPITRTVTEMDNVMFSCLTMNPQPLHIDRHFSAGTEWG